MTARTATGIDLYEAIAENIEKTESRIIYVAGDDFYQYSGKGVYEAVPMETLSVKIREAARRVEAEIRENIPKFSLTVGDELKKNVRAALRDRLFSQNPAVVLNSVTYVLNLENGLLDLNSMVLRAHSPDFFSSVQLKVKFDARATCPRWLRTLDEIFANDAADLRREKIRILQQFFGLCLTPDTSFQKVLILIGQGANGKSLVLFVLRSILGELNYSTIGIDQLLNNFYLHELKNKLVNISSEISSKATISDAMLKQISGEDAITADRKFRDPVKFQAFTRLIFSMNDVPPITDRSHAFYRRLIVIEFTRVFSEDEQDSRLREALAKELDGIFLWALSGRAELLKAGRFLLGEEMKAAVARFRKENNSVIGFVEDWLTLCELGELPKGDVFSAYKSWCAKNGNEAFSQNRFSRILKATYPGITETRHTAGEWIWQGVAFSEQAPADLPLGVS